MKKSLLKRVSAVALAAALAAGRPWIRRLIKLRFPQSLPEMQRELMCSITGEQGPQER